MRVGLKFVGVFLGAQVRAAEARDCAGNPHREPAAQVERGTALSRVFSFLLVKFGGGG